MKRGGLVFAVLLFIAGVLRVSGPGGSAGAQGGSLSTSSASQRIASPAHPPYELDLYRTIEDFYGWPEDSGGAPPTVDHVTVPDCARPEIEFVVAILPDPAHTRLSLFFDRSMEALQQGAQKQRYYFDRAILPWDTRRRSPSSEQAAGSHDTGEQRERESFPGLLIFRDGYDPLPSAGQQPSMPDHGPCRLRHRPLFVFVVGETPTGGVRKSQFRKALQLIAGIRGSSADSPAPPLRILGPSFSGSLDSLADLLREDARKKIAATTIVYSGTVTGRSAIEHFQTEIGPDGAHFASFLENDDFALAQFLQFAQTQGFPPEQIALLSEDQTEYGVPRADRKTGANDDSPESKVLRLHFPREISFFRSAYQKDITSQQDAQHTANHSTLPLDLNSSGNDDDTVPPFNVVQTTLSQESAMLGVISELHKHHTKFTVLLASDPSDQLFLARYLRTSYPQGRVVITVPDLLFAREDDSLLHGVLALGNYPLLPGLDDEAPSQFSSFHEDRLFVSSLSVGEFNAMVGLLAFKDPPLPANFDYVPLAPYAEYAPPTVKRPNSDSNPAPVPRKPFVWLTILGRDGFWPVASLTAENVRSADGRQPVASLFHSKVPNLAPSTLHETAPPPPSQAEPAKPEPEDSEANRHPPAPAWNLALCVCLVVMIFHAVLSWKGTALADSESRAQMARNHKGDWQGAVILSIGAFALASAFVLILLTRSLRVQWDGGSRLTLFLWLLFVIFVGLTYHDLAHWRHKPTVASIFFFAVCLMTGLQLILALVPPAWARVYWSNRLIHLDSGLSPVLPVLLLLAGGYWWMWMSLRAATLVDLKRPRLPEQKDLGEKGDDIVRPRLPESPDLEAVSPRISDKEGEDLRITAHPLLVKWQMVIPVVAIFLIALTVLDLRHPIQTIEGWAFDWGYTALLCLVIGTFLGTLLKLGFTWLKCAQILAGLDRLPLREAFGRMSDLTWHSFWNPGGSTMRETYKIMSRALQNLERLQPLLDAKCSLVSTAGRLFVSRCIQDVFTQRADTLDQFHTLFPMDPPASSDGPLLQRCVIAVKGVFSSGEAHCSNEQALMGRVEVLQRLIARAGAAVMRYILVPFWLDEKTPVVSQDKEMIPREKLPALRSVAEEFVALVYVNFLVSVLLRVRCFVLCSIGLYVCIVLSTSVYPFEPHPGLQALSVILLIILGATVGFVYAEMHREAILSKLTSTNAGELGWDFWLKLASAGAIPLFSLLAAQFPQINQLLFNWLEPALKAVK